MYSEYKRPQESAWNNVLPAATGVCVRELSIISTTRFESQEFIVGVYNGLPWVIKVTNSSRVQLMYFHSKCLVNEAEVVGGRRKWFVRNPDDEVDVFGRTVWLFLFHCLKTVCWG